MPRSEEKFEKLIWQRAEKAEKDAKKAAEKPAEKPVEGKAHKEKENVCAALLPTVVVVRVMCGVRPPP